MEFLPGTYVIHSICADAVIDLVYQHKIEGYAADKRVNQQVCLNHRLMRTWSKRDFSGACNAQLEGLP